MSFEERAVNMGLTLLSNNCFGYTDRYSSVVYKKLQTIDEVEIDYWGVFTAPHDTELSAHTSFILSGMVSNEYKFVGNDTVMQGLRDSIESAGQALLRESHFMDQPKRSQIRTELIISNPTNHRRVGDVYPQLVVENSYNGTKAVNIHFGLVINESEGRDPISFSFNSKLGKLRQVHMSNSRTEMSTVVDRYVEHFSDNILSLLEANFNTELTDEDVMGVLDVIEKTGSRRRHSVSAALLESTKDSDGNEQPITAWNLFLTITKFSTMERNLNIKKYLENAAERVLVVPHEMMNMVQRLNEETRTVQDEGRDNVSDNSGSDEGNSTGEQISQAA